MTPKDTSQTKSIPTNIEELVKKLCERDKSLNEAEVAQAINELIISAKIEERERNIATISNVLSWYIARGDIEMVHRNLEQVMEQLKMHTTADHLDDQLANLNNRGTRDDQ